MAINEIKISDRVTLRRIRNKGEIALLMLGGRMCDYQTCLHAYLETDYHYFKKRQAVWSQVEQKGYKLTGAWKWDYIGE